MYRLCERFKFNTAEICMSFCSEVEHRCKLIKHQHHTVISLTFSVLLLPYPITSELQRTTPSLDVFIQSQPKTKNNLTGRIEKIKNVLLLLENKLFLWNMAFSKLSGQESVLKVDSFEILGKIYLQKFVSHVLFLLLIVFCLKKISQCLPQCHPLPRS